MANTEAQPLKRKADMVSGPAIFLGYNLFKTHKTSNSESMEILQEKQFAFGGLSQTGVEVMI